MDSAELEGTGDPYCLQPGEISRLLTGHPWRRFVVLGDSTAEGVGDQVPNYPPPGWADQIAAALQAVQPALTYLNLGERDLRSAEVHQRQLSAALDFRPDLAMVTCGANDALRPRFDPQTLESELAAIIEPLQRSGALVLTFGLLVMADYPAFPDWYRQTAVERMYALARHTSTVAQRLSTVHTDLSEHPLGAFPAELVSADGLHANARNHTVCAAATIRSLGQFLAKRR